MQHCDERLHAELIGYTSTSYSGEQRDRLLRAMTSGTAAEYSRLAFDLGYWLADAALFACLGDTARWFWFLHPLSIVYIGSSDTATIVGLPGRPAGTMYLRLAIRAFNRVRSS